MSGFWMVKKGQFTNSLDFECDLKSGSQTIWNPDKWPPFFKKPSEIWTKISRFWIIQFHMFRALWKLDFQKVWISNVWILNPTGQEAFVWHNLITYSHYNLFVCFTFKPFNNGVSLNCTSRHCTRKKFFPAKSIH